MAALHQEADVGPRDGAAFCPTGKSAGLFGDGLSSPFCKNIPISEYPNQRYKRHRPVPLEGRIAIVTDAGRDAVDADGAADESI